MRYATKLEWAQAQYDAFAKDLSEAKAAPANGNPAGKYRRISSLQAQVIRFQGIVTRLTPRDPPPCCFGG
jgi:hypothetical protein